MHLSCNFVNVMLIVYSTRLHVYTRASLTDILVRILPRKIARRVGQVGEDPHACRACPARGKLNGEVAGHADILATILAWKSARMSVSVSVSMSVPLNSSLLAEGLCPSVCMTKIGIISKQLYRSDWLLAFRFSQLKLLAHVK